MAYPAGYLDHLLSEVICTSEWGSNLLWQIRIQPNHKRLPPGTLVLSFSISISLAILVPSISRLTPRPSSCWSPFPLSLQACHAVLGDQGESELWYWRAVQTWGLSPGLSVCPSAIETWGAAVGSFPQTYGCHLGRKQIWDVLLHLFFAGPPWKRTHYIGSRPVLSDLNPNLLAPSGQVTKVGAHVHPLTRLSIWWQ